MPDIEWILLYLVLGALVGFMAGLLGLGGGGILVHLLTSIFTYQGISVDNAIHWALGTSLACMIILIAIASTIAASYGARCSHGLPKACLRKIFAVIALILSIKMLIFWF